MGIFNFVQNTTSKWKDKRASKPVLVPSTLSLTQSLRTTSTSMLTQTLMKVSAGPPRIQEPQLQLRLLGIKMSPPTSIHGSSGDSSSTLSPLLLPSSSSSQLDSSLRALVNSLPALLAHLDVLVSSGSS